MSANYVFGRVIAGSHEEVVTRAIAQLALEGFGVLSDIDVAATLKKKLDKVIAPYRILGACNPQFADKALEAEPQIGALLPCNVVVRVDRSGATVVEIMDPNAVLALVDRPEISAIASEVRARLMRALDAI